MSDNVRTTGAAMGGAAVAPPSAGPPSKLAQLLSGGAGRNLGLVVALLVLCLVGVATSGERFASVDNLLT
ncbi:MAG TPA: hypothetical protein VFD41_03150, partial [Actinomycetales bacterium]|nr:hypothetical protein [Actinomycetales bacterium]